MSQVFERASTFQFRRCIARKMPSQIGERRWLFSLIPTLLLRRPRHGGTTGRDELAQQMDAQSRKQGSTSVDPGKQQTVSRTRYELTGAPLAPKTMETLNELRARRRQARQSPMPQEAVDFEPQSPLSLDGHRFQGVLQDQQDVRTLRVCLEILDLLTSAADDFARAAVPAEITRCFMLVSMTALQKAMGEHAGSQPAPVFAVSSLKL